MKKITFLIALLISATSFSQIQSTSFEEPAAIGGKYTDTEDPSTAHPLADNTDEPVINFTTTGGEIGYSASYFPYDTPNVGLSDGDFIGVTAFAPSGSDPYPDGNQGYQISDVDGNYVLEFDTIDSVSSSPYISIDYFIADTGYEGDGTINETGHDRIRIYVKDLTNNTEHDILNSTGTDINDLGIQGQWITGVATGLNGDGATFQLVIEIRCNSSSEIFYFDNMIFNGTLETNDISLNTFSIYPNPANNYLTITSQINGIKNIAIYDILGKQVLNTIASERIDISSLANGVYIVKITQNEFSVTKKLVVR